MAQMQTTDNLQISKSVNGVDIYGSNFSRLGYKIHLTAGVQQAVTVPDGGFNFVTFSTSSGANLQVSPTSGEALPTGTLTPSSAKMNMPVLNVQSGDTFYLRSRSDDDVYMSFYRNIPQ